MAEDRLSDEEYAEATANHKKLQDALNGPRADEVKAALKDFVEFPPKRGKLKD